MALLGPNGAGKSTTIDMMLGLARPDSGRVTLFERSPSEAVAEGRVGGMLQSGSLIEYLSVRELLHMVASLYPHPLDVDEVLHTTGASQFAGQRTTKLSGGQTQRVRFALALVANPDLLVLDEPTAALDVEARRDFWEAMRVVAKGGKIVVFATHYLEEADAHADRIVLMARGRVIADGTATEIKAKAGGRTVHATLPEVDVAALARLPGVTSADRHGDAVVLSSRRRGRRAPRPPCRIPRRTRHRSSGCRARRSVPRARRRGRKGRSTEMTHATYLRYEVLRTFRNRRFLIFSLAFPLVLLLTIGSANRHATVDGISFPLYFMAGMVSWGAMVAMISSGARIAAERQVGWTRQLRITPLRAGAYFRAKILCGYVMVLLTLVVLYLAGSWLGVRLDVKEWVTMTVLILVGLVPFAVIGIMFGHLLKPDSLGPAVGGLTALFALFGGAWGPISTGHGFVDVVKCIPSYWLVQAGKSALGRSGWPPAQAWIVVAAWTVVAAWLAVLAYRRDTARV